VLKQPKPFFVTKTKETKEACKQYIPIYVFHVYLTSQVSRRNFPCVVVMETRLTGVITPHLTNAFFIDFSPQRNLGT